MDASADGLHHAPAGLVAALSPFVPADALPAALDRLRGERAVVVRVNTLRGELLSTQRELIDAGLDARPIDAAPGALVLPAGSRAALQATAAHAAGRVYLQGLSSQLVPLALLPRAGERVLDLCAAPGSKTSQMAALMGGGRGLLANERSRARLHRLRAVLEQLGVDSVELSCRPGQTFGRSHPGAFERVLVDAPCSMEGRLRWDDAHAASAVPAGRLRRLAAEQRGLLAAAIDACAPGGVIVYATCTLAPEENELVLHKLLRRHGDRVRLEPLPWDLPDALPGLRRWRERDLDPQLVHARRLLPDERREGFFVARLRRLGGSD